MEGTKNTPAIRFVGFTDAWEQRKLSSIADRITRKNAGLESTLPLTISAQYGLVDQVTYFNNRVASQNISSYYLIQNGEFAYNKSSSDGYPFGAVKRLDLYEIGVLSTLYIVFALKDQTVSSDFLACYYDTDNWHKQVSERAAEGARNHGLLNISAEDFLDTDLLIPPDIREQALIGDYLKKVDSIITLHQRKHEKLISFKKSCLERMFPRNGSLYPEVRFSGFTDAWEQRKLGELYEKNDERNVGQFPWDKTISISTMTFNENGNGAADESLASYKVLRVGDIAFEGHTSKEFRYGRFVLNDLENGIMSPRFTTLRPIISQDYGFWKYYIHDERVMRSKLVNSTKAGTMMNELVVEDLLKQNILVPSIDEQRKIGVALCNIDDLITLHQRELDKLRNLKKSLLQKMFV